DHEPRADRAAWIEERARTLETCVSSTARLPRRLVLGVKLLDAPSELAVRQLAVVKLKHRARHKLACSHQPGRGRALMLELIMLRLLPYRHPHLDRLLLLGSGLVFIGEQRRGHRARVENQGHLVPNRIEARIG